MNQQAELLVPGRRGQRRPIDGFIRAGFLDGDAVIFKRDGLVADRLGRPRQPEVIGGVVRAPP